MEHEVASPMKTTSANEVCLRHYAVVKNILNALALALGANTDVDYNSTDKLSVKTRFWDADDEEIITLRKICDQISELYQKRRKKCSI